jgi:hypothetical protein
VVDATHRYPRSERRFPPERLELRRAHLISEVRNDLGRTRTRRLQASPFVSRPRVALVVAALAAAVLVAPAFGLQRQVLDLFSLADRSDRGGTVSLPGRPIEPDALLLGTLEDQPQIRAATVRQVAAAGRGPSALTLVAALDKDGAVCVASKNAGVMSDFECLDAAGADSQAIFRFSSSGGSNPRALDWVTVVGFVRSDVVRVTGITSAGKAVPVEINPWLGFGFSSPAAELPVSLRAYNADGELVNESALTPSSPLCGGDAGPCR